VKKEYLIWALVNPKGMIADVSLHRATVANMVAQYGGKKAGWTSMKIKGPQPWFAGPEPAAKTKTATANNVFKKPTRKTTKRA
jgi:hypothetical protein